MAGQTTLKFAINIIALLALFPLQGYAREATGARLAFESTVESPSLITYCKGFLWAYSPPSRTLTRLDSKTGAIISTTTLDFITARLPIQSMTCWKDSLLLAVSRHIQRFEIAEQHTPLMNQTISPVAELKGLQCDADTCVALGKSAKYTSDLNNWTVLGLKESKDIETVQNHLKENPFGDWHEQFQLSKSRYSKSAFGADGRLFLLDALRSAVVSLPKDFNLEPKRWGTFGHFEGDMTYPRGIAVLKNGDVAVSDTGLKLVFVFGSEGEYKGFVGSDVKRARFGYPIDIVVHDDILYVADFSENKINGIDLSKVKWDRNSKPTTVDELLLEDLFQHPAVQKMFERTRCLSCHDGTEVNSLQAFGKMKFHHPVGVALKPEMLAQKIDLPIGPGKTVGCNSCHDAHHENHSGQTVSHDGKITLVKELPFHLRKSVRQLCITCHLDHSDSAHNHIDLKSKKQGVATAISCGQCHLPHGSFEKMLVLGIPGTCVSCHKGQHDQIHEHAEKFTRDNCLACHAVHSKEAGKAHGAFIKDMKSLGAATCVDCHKELHSLMETNPHLKSQMKNRGDQAACLRCHLPHQSKALGVDLCISCHKERNQFHPALIAISDTDRAKGINLKHEKITCVTCHEPHGKAGQLKLLREKEPLLQFCSSCHGLKSPKLFEFYHKRTPR